MIKIDCGCTPRMELKLDIDPNPNGYPVLWISIYENGKHKYGAPLSREAAEELTRNLQSLVTEM